MDPISHGLVGLAAGSFSGESGVLTNPLALGCLIGSIIPDGDIIMQYWGDYAYLKNHRGASHSFAGMTAISLAVSLLINLIFKGSSFLIVFLWTYIGCLTHVGFDLLNSYGAKLLWPFSNKKYGSGLLLSFDPFLAVTSIIVYWFNSTNRIYIKFAIGAFAAYLLFRQWRKIQIRDSIVKKLGFTIDRIVLLPSMTGLFSWDFIVYTKREIVTGRSSMLGKKIIIRDRMQQSNSWIKEIVMNTDVGRFFSEFTKEYHISLDKLENGTIKATLTDLRYFVKNRYIHHATIYFDRNFNPVECLFQPYNIKRSSKLSA